MKKSNVIQFPQPTFTEEEMQKILTDFYEVMKSDWGAKKEKTVKLELVKNKGNLPKD